MEPKINLSAILAFVELCRSQDLPETFIWNQVELFCQGVRDVRLHDNCIVLIGGTDNPF